MYGPSGKELREIIQDEGSFMINKILARDVISDMDKKKSSMTPKMVALATRAAYEPMIAQHFGSQGQVVEEFERTVEWHVSAGTRQHEGCFSGGLYPIYVCLWKRRYNGCFLSNALVFGCQQTICTQKKNISVCGKYVLKKRNSSTVLLLPE